MQEGDRRRIWSGDQEGSGIFWKLSLAFISAAGVRMPDRVAYRTFHEEGNRGTNMVLDSISSDASITPATGPLIFISTVLTHLTGGSAGREGAALQLGGSIGSLIGKALHLDQRDLKIAVMCGMSGCFGALFGTPLAAAVFVWK